MRVVLVEEVQAEPALNQAIWDSPKEWSRLRVSSVPPEWRTMHVTGSPGRQLPESDQAHPVVLADAVVVGWIGEGERQKALLLEVGLVDAGEAAGYDRRTPSRRGDRAACSRLLPSP